MATTKPPVLTPMRSPMPPRRAPVGVGRWGGASKAAGAAAASSSEKETPTVVFTENSPHSNIRGSGERVVASWAKPEKLFQDDDSDASSSSPRSEAGPSEGRDVDEDEDDSSDPSDGVDDGTRESRATRGGKDNDGGDDDVSSDDSEGSRHRKVVSIIQNVLDMGIASVCRLRKIFPPSFYQKYDSPYDGTTITQFNEGALRRMCMDEGRCEDEDKGEDDNSRQSDNEGSDDEAPRVKTQKSLSPLTEISQKYNDGTGGRFDRAVFTNEEKRMAMEALLLLRWMQKGGVNEILRDGNLARLVFGICVPSEETSGGANNDELIESYSFNISYKRPENPGEVEEDEVNEAVGSVFQNLNGFQAGRSLSQSVVPSKTQASFLSLSQSSRAPSHGGGTQTQMSSMDFFPRSQMEMSQKSLMESMSQSIRVSVKKNRGRAIPKTRYLTLRVEFTNSMSPNELPPSLKQNCLETSPVSIIGGNSGEPSCRGSKHHTDRFIVTPLGRISESGYSGVCVDMFAKTKVDGKEDDEDDYSRFCSTRHSQSSYPFDGDDRPLTQPFENVVDINNEQNVNERWPLTQRQEKQNGFRTGVDPSKNMCSDRIENCIKSQRGDMPDIDNIEVQVGSKAFGQPYGLKGGNEYILCNVIDHRITKSCVDGKEKEEFKCVFNSNELRTSGRKKQWLPQRRMISYKRMAENVEGALGRISAKKRGESMRSVGEEVARELNISFDFVQEIAKKRKEVFHVGNIRSKKSKS